MSANQSLELDLPETDDTSDPASGESYIRALEPARDLLPNEDRSTAQTVGIVTAALGAAVSVGGAVVTAVQTGEVTSLFGAAGGAVTNLAGAIPGGQQVSQISGVATSALGAATGAVSQVASAASGVAGTANALAESHGVFGDLVDFAQAWVLGRPKYDPRVEYHFETTRTREGVLDRHAWTVETMSLVEDLNDAYAIEIVISSRDTGIDPSDLLGANAQLLVQRTPIERPVRGIVRHVGEGGRDKEYARYRVTVVPAFQLMSHRITSRIFQDMTAVEILEKVLHEGLSPFERRADLSKLQAKYSKREYCVQYTESDFAFCSRLMEEEGIAYYFSHDDKHEVLHLVDYGAEGKTLLFPAYEPAGGLPVSILAEGRTGVESCTSLERDAHLTAQRVRVYHWDWSRGTAEIKALSEEAAHPYLQVDRQDVWATDYLNHRYTKSTVTQRAELARAEQRFQSLRCRGASSVTHLSPGQVVEFTEHSNPDLNGRFLITRVEHGDTPVGGNDASSNYGNHFECIPVDHRFVPERLHLQPSIPGFQLARVCGPADPADRADDVAYTDEWGRIKLWFSGWDHTPHNPRAGDHHFDGHTCWVRVQQMLAGGNYGALFIPHVGMDVVVTFEEGDPDKPLVIGASYAGNNKPPYISKEAEPTGHIQYKMGLITHGKHELRFDDKPGEELIHLHSSKDHERDIVNDETITIGHDQSTTVRNDRTVHVVGNQNHLIEQNDSTVVTGNRYLEVNGGQNFTTVQGLHHLKVEGDPGRILVEAATEIVLRVGNSKLVIDGEKIELHAASGAKIVLTDVLLARANDGAQLELAEDVVMADQGLGRLHIAEGDLTMKSSNGAITTISSFVKSEAGTSALVVSDASIEGAADQVILASKGASLELGPTDATLTAQVAAQLQGPMGTVTCGAADVSIASSALCNIQGATVNLNG